MKFKEKEDHELLFVDYDLWDSRDNRYAADFTYIPWLEKEYTSARKVGNLPIYTALHGAYVDDMRAMIEKEQEYINNHYVFKNNDKLFFHKGCTIPRTKGEGHWQRVIKIDKADAVVLPPLKKITLMENCALFTDISAKKIYVVSHLKRIKEPFDIGDTLRQVIDNNAENIHKDFFTYNSKPLEGTEKAVCTYKGNVVYYSEQCDWLFDLFEGSYKKVIFEDELITQIGTDEQKLTLDSAESIMTMLRSKDAESVHAGMRLLASMDYANYPSLTRWILSETDTNWGKYTPFNSSVKFMFKEIKYKQYANMPFHKVMPSEFDITKEMYSNIIKKNMDYTINHLQSMTNMRLDIRFDFDVFLDLEDGKVLGTAPKEEPEEIPEELPEEPEEVTEPTPEPAPEVEPEETPEPAPEPVDDSALDMLLPDSTQLELLFILSWLMLYVQTITSIRVRDTIVTVNVSASITRSRKQRLRPWHMPSDRQTGKRFHGCSPLKE